MNGASSQRVVTGPSPAEGFLPSRVLILSGEMGEGHNSAAAALTAAIAQVWPGCAVERYDTLDLRGRRFAQAASRGYGFQMKRVPRSYDLYYDWLCRSEGVAAVSKAAIGRFFGVPLEPFLAQHPHDLVISVFPQASAALDWLRSKRGYAGPTVTYIPAFHVHPGWTFPGIDRHFVMYDSAARDARTPGFETTMRLGAPPVREVFGTVNRADARKALGLDDERFVVLVTGGAWGLGNISEAVRSLFTSLPPDLQLVAACGKNLELSGRLRRLGLPKERLRVLGYVTNMHEQMAAADVVVTNGAGVTVLESLCTARPVVAFCPLAGHGSASTDELVRRGLALRADDVPALVSAVTRLYTDETLRNRMSHAGEVWSAGRDLRNTVRQMEELFVRRAPALSRS